MFLKFKILPKVIITSMLVLIFILLINNIIVKASIPLITIENSIKIFDEIAEKNVDMQYITEALNMSEPYIYKLTETTKNFRLYNGNISDISIGKISDQCDTEYRIYNRDEGKGSANVMRCLFPSSAGTLSSEGGFGELPCFTKDCNPTPELIAKISNYLYKVRKNNSKINDELNNINKVLETLNIESDKLKVKTDKLKKKDTKSVKIGDLSAFEAIKKFCKENLDLEEDDKGIISLFDLLRNMTYMIQNEESDNENPTNDDIKLKKILPKYTTEHMLMYYFIDHFNTENQVIEFYSKIKDLIKTDITEENNTKSFIKNLKNLNYLIEKAGFNESSPYLSNPIGNGDTKIIEIDSNDKTKIKIMDDLYSKKFQDCADVVIRHTMNFLLYNDNKFNLVQDGKEKDLKNLIDAINNNDTFEFKSLKERLQLFYLYQTKDRVNDGSVLTRTLWSYVISNMNNIEQMTLLNLYPIKYVNNKGCELETGFVNMIKLCYNLSYVLKDGQDCNEAKVAIDKLNKKRSENNFKIALEKTLQILNSKASVTDMIIEFGDYGSAAITINNEKEQNQIYFKICQREGHNFIEYNALNKILIDSKIKKIIKKNSIAKLLVFKVDNYINEELSFFYRLYSSLNIRNEQNNYKNKYVSLLFLNYFQGEENNAQRIVDILNINIKFLNGAKFIKIKNTKFQNDVSLLDHIFIKYIYNNFKYINKKKQIKIENIVNNLVLVKKNGVKYFINKYNNTCIVYRCNKKQIHNKLEIPQFIFDNNKKYEVTNIKENAFQNCINLKELSIPSGIKTINRLFNKCKNLEKVILSNGVTEISYYAFEGCINLKEIILPSSVKIISKLAFLECINLKQITISNGLVSIGKDAFYGCTSLKEITIPSSVKIIDQRAFLGCTSLEKVIILNGIVELGDSAFEECINLKEIILPPSMKIIGEKAFFKCRNLEKATISHNIVKISYRAFSECSSLKELLISPGTEIIGTYAFSRCINLKKLIIPLSVKVLDNGAFLGCTNLEKIVLPDGVKELKSHVFSECKSLKEITLPSSVTLIDEYAFSRCISLEGTLLLSNVEKINRGAFMGCLSLEKIVLPDTTIEIANLVFSECTKLKEIEVNVNNPNYSAIHGILFDKNKTVLKFYPAGKLQEEYVIPDTVIKIDDKAFFKCPYLKKIIIKKEFLKEQLDRHYLDKIIIYENPIISFLKNFFNI